MIDSETNVLREALGEVDLFAHAELTEIATIARLALAAMELPRTAQAHEMFAVAFQAIASKASSLNNDLNCIAERCGCNFVDEERAARSAAAAHWQPAHGGLSQAPSATSGRA